MIRAWLAVLLSLLAGSAGAHAVPASHLDLRSADGRQYEVAVDVPIRDVALAVPLDADGDERVTWGELRTARRVIEEKVFREVGVATSGPCRWSPETYAVRQYDDGAYVALGLRLACPRRGALTVDYRLFHDQDPGHRAWLSLVVAGRAKSAVVGRGGARFDTGAQGGAFADYVGEGVRHILAGYDHLAFLLTLLLTAVLARREGRWVPEPTARVALANSLKLLTSFTLAHSITLSLAALEWVVPAAKAIEVFIAITVALVALHNVRPVIETRAWILAFAFGLIHGFGFAGALGELGLPAGARLQALAGFNIGVELGQLAVVAVVLPPLLFVSRRRIYAGGLMQALSLAIAVLAGTWIWARLRA